MKQYEAEKLLNETFNKEFNLEKYVAFLKELLKGKMTIQNKPFNVSKEFKDQIKSFIKIGDYTSGRNNIELLVAEANSLDKARTSQRNFVAKWLNNAFLPKDAALVAFYSPNQEDWRFSFVKMEYKFDEKGKPTKELTPAKRYSFLVGKNEPNHTCKQQFLDLLIEENTPPTLDELEKAFSVDNVTKIFFDEYKNRFIQLKEAIELIMFENPRVKAEFELKDINSVEFSKKLLGQIVFLYFLQKKGWLGIKKTEDGFDKWGTGPKDFMKKLFDKKLVEYDNFFKDILAPLFYQALANDRRADKDYYEKLKCKIPFLNGGLFEPIKAYAWETTDIKINDDIFKDIFSTFDRFNFTIKEDEPFEKEVAIDPEMLGKVFENLLDVIDRKSKGAFYTPREIVHYMCQQSLINYLETNTKDLKIKREEIELFIQQGDIALSQVKRILELIKSKELDLIKEEDSKWILPESIRKNYKEIDNLLLNIKICDPAVGSGAFPVGMMNEIVKARNILSYFFNEREQKERTDYNLKRQTIENSLYGVDIEPSAVEITKLRFWLSLIVDEDSMENISPLPNLDNKIMCGNSLIEGYKGIKLFDKSLILSGVSTGRQMTLVKKESEYKFEVLQHLQNDLFNEQIRLKKQDLIKRIDDIEWEFIEETLKEQKKYTEIKELQIFKSSKIKPYFIWELCFPEVFKRENPGFDVIIANPPYIGEDGHKNIFQPIAQDNLSIFYQGKMDIFYFFFHLGLNMGRQKSQISFITTNYYPTAFGAEKLRADFKNRAIVRNLINFSELKIFESAKGQHNMITILSKEKDDKFIAKTCETSRKGIANPQIISSILTGKDAETNYYNITQKDLYDGEKNYIRITGSGSDSKDPINKILNKIKENSNNDLKYYCNINQGVVSGCDTLSNGLMSKIKNKENVDLGEGIFVLDIKKLVDKKLIDTFNKKEKYYLKAFFKNSEIGKWHCNTFPTKFLLYLDKSVNNLNDLPNIRNHLDKFKEILIDRREVQLSRIKYYHLQWARKAEIFAVEKIVVPYRSRTNSFTYNNVEWFCRSDCYVLTKKNNLNLKYLLAILNSKLYYVWLYFKGKRKGDILELFQTPLSEIPIKESSKDTEKKFIELVNKILEITNDEDYLKKIDKQARVKIYEEEIDKMVYALYKLTPEEIKIIERFNETKQ
ncbi:MAG: TaqI-like C-terminal specificity domain-containing protein [Sphaerochaetaceae bacterium]|nr:TaqI-like C-terminal specificity domain-containing protein [Sphaerochaetaceae bacterium]